MGILNIEQSLLDKCKDELKDKTDSELQEISRGAAKTSLFFTSGKTKLYQNAAFQLLRERKNAAC